MLDIPEDLIGVFVQMKGWQRSLQPLTKTRILALRSLTEPKVPRWMAWRSMIPKQDRDQVQP